jgi:hypothetical protein
VALRLLVVGVESTGLSPSETMNWPWSIADRYGGFSVKVELDPHEAIVERTRRRRPRFGLR